jgi:hypothetical protein
MPLRIVVLFSDDGTPADEKYEQRAVKFLEELEWYAYALQKARSKPCDRSACSGRDRQ